MNKLLKSVWILINIILLLLTIYLNFITLENNKIAKIVALVFFISNFMLLFLLINIKYRKNFKDENY